MGFSLSTEVLRPSFSHEVKISELTRKMKENLFIIIDQLTQQLSFH